MANNGNYFRMRPKRLNGIFLAQSLPALLADSRRTKGSLSDSHFDP